MIHHGKVDFRYPRIGARIKFFSNGYDAFRIGSYIGNTENGSMILDTDIYNLLPIEFKTEIIPITQEFVVL